MQTFAKIWCIFISEMGTKERNEQPSNPILLAHVRVILIIRSGGNAGGQVVPPRELEMMTARTMAEMRA